MSIKAIMLTVFSLVSLAFLPAAALSQETVATLPLESTQFKFARLAPGLSTAQVVVPLDSATKIDIGIISNASGLVTSIVTPGGQVINASNVASFGGAYNAFAGETAPPGLLALPIAERGFHYIYEFPAQGAGNYTVQFQSPTNPTGDVAIITEVRTDSAIRTTLFATEPAVRVGDPVVLSAAVFNGQTAISGANVAIHARVGTTTPITTTLLDDGGAADDASGDGLYSGEFTPTQPGDYRVFATITGTSGGASFTRHSTTVVKVVNVTSRLTGTVQDQGVDDNADGMFDRIALNIQTNTTVAGSYALIAHLRTASGQKVTRGATVTLATGLALSTINFEAAAFLELGENGPYTIELIELFHLTTLEPIPADRLENVGQTQAYTLVQLQRPALVVTNPKTAVGIDTNNNGKYDVLRVRAQVLALQPGFYEWTAVLADPAGNEIQFLSTGGHFVAGSNFLQMDFSGSAIGQHAVNGPYTVKSLILFGQGASTIVDRLLDTQAFSYKEFENSDNIRLGTVTTTEASGDGDSSVEPGETGSFSIQLTNVGSTAISGINATLSTSTPGVTITSATSTYPNLAASGSGVNATPFTFTVASEVPCAKTISFKLTITHTGDGGIPSVLHFSIQSGRPTGSSTFSYTGAAVAIPDNQAAGVNIPITVSGLTGSLKDINFRFDGSACSSTEGSTTVGLSHGLVGDLVATLTSPGGTKVKLLIRPGAGAVPSFGNNFCNTVLDDEGGGTPIQNISESGQPYSGTFIPAESLAAFRGENPNGTWTLNVADMQANFAGHVRAFSLVISQADCALQSDKILFKTDRDGHNALYLMNPDGSNPTKISSTTNSHTNAVWVPNGNKVAFVVEQEGTNSWDIFTMNTDGSNRVNLTQNTAFELHFAVSPNSNKIAFESDRDGSIALWIMNTDGTGVTRLLTTGGADQRPAWSPDSSKLAFVSYINTVAGKADIFKMNPDGTGLINLTQSDAVESRPVWSPDGTKILFGRRSTVTFSPWNMYVMNADGSNVQLLRSNVLTDFAWSPDSTKIAFSSNSSGNNEVYVMNADGTNQVNLTNNSNFDSLPMWSKDGLKILFTTFRTGNSETFVMNANGSNQTNLTNHTANDQSPQWRP